jgi:hypothetical protein
MAWETSQQLSFTEGRYQWLHTYTIYIVNLLRMSGRRSKHLEELNFKKIVKIVYQVGINKRIILRCTANQISRPLYSA